MPRASGVISVCCSLGLALGLALSAAGCGAKPTPTPVAPTPIGPTPAALALTVPDELTMLSCQTFGGKPADVAPIWCGMGGCELSYTATPITEGPGGYETGKPHLVERHTSGWRFGESNERLRAEIVDGERVVLEIDGLLASAAGTEATIANDYVAVIKSPGAAAPAYAAVSIAGAPTGPATVRDDVRLGARCVISIDLQE